MSQKKYTNEMPHFYRDANICGKNKLLVTREQCMCIIYIYSYLTQKGKMNNTVKKLTLKINMVLRCS